jgi:SAM-dependent methyltransferase
LSPQLDLRGGVADAELEEFLAACPTSVAQQTPGWRRVIEAIGVDEPHLLACRRRGALVGILPAWRFRGPFGAILVSCVQAGPLGGVACHPEADREEVYSALLDGFLALAGEQGCAVATVITNPFWPDRELCEKGLAPDYVLENVCQVLDLATGLDDEGSPTGGSQNLRRNLRKACSGALRIDEEQSAANLKDWYAIHERRHRSIGATPLPEALFTAALEHAVPAGVARFFFVRLTATDELVGGGLYLHHGSVIDALMPSVASEHAELGTAFLLALHSMRWARARGLRHYNWQPSPPGGGVLRFKQQWGSADLRYAYLTRVTGDAAPILAAGVEAVKQGYPFHYVLPFDRIGASAAAGASTRERAWQAAQGPARSEPQASEARSGRPLERSVVEHYEKQLARHGPTARGMDWKDEASQELRFRVLCEVCDLEGRSLHDVGCGAGHLLGFLERQGVAVDYTGSDASARMLESARRLHPGARFEPWDLREDPPAETWDVVVCSGLFSVKLAHPDEAWWSFVKESLRRMYAMCRVAIAFNLMSDRVDWRADNLFYASPAAVEAFCRAELSPRVKLRHDYPLHEYTVYVHREPSVQPG